MCCSEWARIVDENSIFLERVARQINMKADYNNHLNKVLLSSTHISGLIECESFWPATEGKRDALLSRLTDESDRDHIQRLACYVWQERYLNTGMERELGGWIFLDMIQVRAVLLVISSILRALIA